MSILVRYDRDNSEMVIESALGCTPRDVIKEPLNGIERNYSAVNEFATNFAMSTTRFADLVRVHKGYPRKPIA